MLEFLPYLFDTNDFPPRWECGDWSVAHGWLHVISDLSIFAAYFAIPLVLGWALLKKRQELPFPSLVVLFSAFILSCGLAHLVEATIFWKPWYRFSGALKVLTAIISWATVIALIRIAPRIVRYTWQVEDARTIEEHLEEERTTRERLELLLDSTEEGIFGIDAKGMCTFANRAGARKLGYRNAEDMVGENIDAYLFHGEDLDAESGTSSETAALRPAVTRRKFHSDKGFFHRRDGQRFPVEFWSNPILREGRHYGAVITFVDISNRKEQEEELIRVNFLSDTALDLTRSGYWHIPYDESGYYYSSDRAVEIFGDPPREDHRYRIMEEWFENVRAGDEAAAEVTLRNYTEALEGKKPSYDATYAYRRPVDGRVVWIHALGRVFRNEKGEATDMFGVTQDITAFKELEEQLVTAKETAEDATRAKSEFLANMSHEIRTPMNAILGFSELMEGVVVSEKAKNYLSVIRSSGESLLELINDLLDLSKIEAGHVELNPEPMDLMQTVNATVALVAPQAEKKKLALTVDPDSDLPRSVVLDRIRLRQILLNLLSNAVKFTEAGSVSVRIGLETTEEENDRVGLVFSVSDTGRGVSPDQKEKIFLPFHQENLDEQSVVSGTGLGLNISQRLAELMGGSIELTSELGKGSTFTLRIPTVEISDEEPQTTQRTDKEKVDFNRLPPSKILIADDNELNRDLIEGLLADTHHEVRQAKDGAEAVRIARNGSYDIVLMDIRMPRIDGREALRILKDFPDAGETPVVAVTASSLLNKEKILREEFDGYLRKPFTSEQLFQALSSHLGLLDEHVEQGPVESPETEESSLHLHENDKPDTWSDLVDELEELTTTSWTTARQVFSSLAVGDFSKNLVRLGEEHHCNALVSYARTLGSNMELFLVERVEKDLAGFPEVIDWIRGHS